MAIEAIPTGLHQSANPLFEWATLANGVLYTAQIPIDAQGEVVAGGIEAQARQVLDNLVQTLAAAGATVSDVAQVTIYVTARECLPAFNRIYREYFGATLPNRAAMVVAGLARPEMLVELVVTAVPSCCRPSHSH